VTISRLESWQEIEALSQQLSELAHQEEWETLRDVASKRHQMIEMFFSEDIPIDIYPDISAGINHIQEMDDEIVRLAQLSREKISNHLQEIAKGKQVIEAYSKS